MEILREDFFFFDNKIPLATQYAAHKSFVNAENTFPHNGINSQLFFFLNMSVKLFVILN